MLFMIDTCQANTMYSKFYSPNIIATGSSEIDQSSYSHHADNDVGVAVIDRYTYYNLDFLETEIREPSSKKTIGDLFDSYDEGKIHSKPGVRWDLYPGGEMEGRRKLVMDFFGNVQNVEMQGEGEQGRWNETAWKEDLDQLKKMIEVAKQRHNTSTGLLEGIAKEEATIRSVPVKLERAAKVAAEEGLGKQVVAAAALLGCIGVWFGASWLDGAK
jgi:glycosylphosphatidylinositol transamidase (GPIT) subunit GPI8